MHSLDGHDEISLTSDVRVYSTRSHFHKVTVADFGLAPVEPGAIGGAETLEDNATLLSNILKGSTVDQRRVQAANAALALTVWDAEATLDAAFSRALDVLDSGRVHDHLQSLIS